MTDDMRILPCAHCGSVYHTISASRFKGSLSCDDCGECIFIDCSDSPDADLGQLIRRLIENWNRRAPIPGDGGQDTKEAARCSSTRPCAPSASTARPTPASSSG